MMRVIKRPFLSLLLAGQLFAFDSSLEQGVRAFREGRFSAAMPLLQRATESRTDAKKAQVFLALAQAAIGHCGDALPLLSKASTDADANLSRLSGLAAAKCHSAANQTTKALAVLDDLRKRFPNDADVLYLLAKVNMKAFNDATYGMFQRTPQSYRVHELSAEIFEVQSRYADAVSEYRKAIELSPQSPDLHFRLGRALLLEGHRPAALEQAADEFKAELAISPEDGACEFQLGQIAQVQGKGAEAQRHLERALALSPDFVQARVALGRLYAQQKAWEKAIATLSRAVELQPDSEAAHYALLTAYRDAGQREKARAEKATLDRLQKPPEGEFSEFLKKLGEKSPEK